MAAQSSECSHSLLYQHYGQKVVLLIDEYDVPLDKAYHHGYYREMVDADPCDVRRRRSRRMTVSCNLLC